MLSWAVLNKIQFFFFILTSFLVKKIMRLFFFELVFSRKNFYRQITRCLFFLRISPGESETVFTQVNLWDDWVTVCWVKQIFLATHQTASTGSKLEAAALWTSRPNQPLSLPSPARALNFKSALASRLQSTKVWHFLIIIVLTLFTKYKWLWGLDWISR